MPRVPWNVDPIVRVKSKGVRGYWMLLVGFGAGIVFVGVLLAIFKFVGKQFKSDHLAQVNAGIVGLGVLLVGVVCILVARRLERSLDGTSDATLVKSYQERFFLWIGLGEAPAFVGIIALVATGAVWLYPLGALFSFIAYAHLAPTGDHLHRDQESLNRRGIERSLRAALEAAPASPFQR